MHNIKNTIGITIEKFQFSVFLIMLFISLVVVTIIDETADMIPVIVVQILTAFSFIFATVYDPPGLFKCILKFIF